MAQQKQQHWRAFDEDWFRRHQSILLRLCNAPVIGRWFRRKIELQSRLPLILLTPDTAHYREDGAQCVAHCYTSPRHSRALYDALKPLWWLLHYWDELVADRWLPELSFGFDQLTIYTGQYAVQNFDGMITSSAASYSAARSGTGSALLDYRVGIFPDIDSTLFAESSRIDSTNFTVSRIYLKFNLTSLNLVTVSIANLKLAAISRQNTSTHTLKTYAGPMTNTQTELGYDDWVQTVTPTTELGSIGLAFINVYENIDYTTDIATSAAFRSYLASRAGQYAPLVCRHSRDSFSTNPTSNNISFVQIAGAEYRHVYQGVTSFLPPLLEITYQRGVLPAGFAVNVVFGTVQISQTNPVATPGSIAINVTFGTPNVNFRLQYANVTGFAITSTFGTPRIPVAQPSGIPVSVTFGQPVINVLQPVGLPVTVEFGYPVITRGRVIWPASMVINVTFGTPSVTAVASTAYPASIPIEVRFGFPSVLVPYPDGTLYPGPYISRILDQPTDYQVTRYEYEDGSASVNVQPSGAKRWILEYDGLTIGELNQLVRFYNSMRGQANTFAFYHRRDNVTYTRVRFVSMQIPTRTKAWNNAATVTIERLY